MNKNKLLCITITVKMNPLLSWACAQYTYAITFANDSGFLTFLSLPVSRPSPRRRSVCSRFFSFRCPLIVTGFAEQPASSRNYENDNYLDGDDNRIRQHLKERGYCGAQSETEARRPRIDFIAPRSGRTRNVEI